MGDYEAIDKIDRGSGRAELRPAKIVVTKTITGNDLLTLDDAVVLVDTTGGAVTVDLPAAASALNKVFYIKKIAGANDVTVDANGAELIDDSTTYVISVLFESVTIVSDGTQWWVL